MYAVNLLLGSMTVSPIEFLVRSAGFGGEVSTGDVGHDGGASCGRKDLTVAQAHHSYIVILRRNADAEYHDT